MRSAELSNASLKRFVLLPKSVGINRDYLARAQFPLTLFRCVFTPSVRIAKSSELFRQFDRSALSEVVPRTGLGRPEDVKSWHIDRLRPCRLASSICPTWL